jgi:hypothetical protein
VVSEGPSHALTDEDIMPNEMRVPLQGAIHRIMVAPCRKPAGRTGQGRSRGGFRLTYALLATGNHPVADVSLPVGAPVPGAYFEGDRRPIYSDREGSGRTFGLDKRFPLLLWAPTGATGDIPRSRCSSSSRRTYPGQRISIRPRSKVPGHRDAFGVFS